MPRGRTRRLRPFGDPAFFKLADHNGFLVLYRMAQQDEPVTMTAFTLMSESNPSRARVAREEMERLGLISVERGTPRGPVPSMLIHLTPQGRKVGAILLDVDKLMREPGRREAHK